MPPPHDGIAPEVHAELRELARLVTESNGTTRVAVAEVRGAVDTLAATMAGQIELAATERRAMAHALAELDRTVDSRIRGLASAHSDRLNNLSQQVDQLRISWAKLAGAAVGLVVASSGIGAAVAQIFP